MSENTFEPIQALIASGDEITDDARAEAFASLTFEDRDALIEQLRAAAESKPVNLTAAQTFRAAIDHLDAQAALEAENAVAAAALLEGVELVDDAVDEPEAVIAEAQIEDDEPAEEAEPVAEVEEIVEDELEPVAAAPVEKPKSKPRPRVVAAADVEEVKEPLNIHVRTVGLAAGNRLPEDADMKQIAEVFARDARHATSKSTLVTVEKDFPENRILTPHNVALNDERLMAVASPQALAASGGICDPLPGDQDKKIFGDRSRPIRDALGTFGTFGRAGGVRYTPAFTLSNTDASDGVIVWDHATDVDPGEATKTVWIVDCDEEETAYVDAVTARAQIGNFAARFSGNLWQRALEFLMVLHDRTAEQNLLSRIDAASTAVTYTGTPATSISNVLQAADKLAAGIRSRLRLNPNSVIQIILDQWVRDALRADFGAQRVAYDGQFGKSNGQIDALFAARGIQPIFSPDVDVFAAQGAGAIQEWPGGSTTMTAFPAGTHLFLDGGVYDLGADIVDSTLIDTNDRQAFLETFEGVLHYQDESYTVTVPVDEDCRCADILEVEADAGE